MQLFFPWQLHICELGGGHPKIPLSAGNAFDRVFKKKAPPLCPSMGKHTHTYIEMRTHLRPTLISFYTPTQQCAHTHIWTNAEREQWRVSVLSERMPFLTPLSKYPCVNTADQMAERETDRDRERKTETEVLLESREQNTRTFLYSYNHTCMSVYQSVWPYLTLTLKLLRPHFHMQQANGSVAMVTTERPGIF